MAIPQGQVGIRQILEGLGETVNWDPVNGITTASGKFNFKPGTFQSDNGVSYMDPGLLGGIISSAKPRDFSQSDVDTAAKLFEPQQTALQARAKLLQSAIDTRLKNGIRTADAAYDQAKSNLESNKENSLDNLRAQMGSRGVSTSGPATGSLRKLETDYGNQQENLESSRAANIANLQDTAAQSSSEVAGQILSDDANLLSQIYQTALNNYNTSVANDNSRYGNMANYLLGLENTNNEKAASDLEYQRQKELNAISHNYDVDLANLGYSHDKEMAGINHNYSMQEKSASSSSKSMTNNEKAQGYIQRNSDSFASPNDFYQQVLRNMQAGTVDYSLGQTILKQLKSMYGDKIKTKTSSSTLSGGLSTLDNLSL